MFAAVHLPPKGGGGPVSVRATPSRFVLRPPWKSESSTSFDFTSVKQKNVRRSHIRRKRRLTDRLDAFATIKSLLMRCQRSPFLRPSTETSLGPRYGSFRLENWLEHSLSLLDGSCIGDFAARQAYGGDDGNQQSFSSFRRFSSSTALMI